MTQKATYKTGRKHNAPEINADDSGLSRAETQYMNSFLDCTGLEFRNYCTIHQQGKQTSLSSGDIVDVVTEFVDANESCSGCISGRQIKSILNHITAEGVEIADEEVVKSFKVVYKNQPFLQKALTEDGLVRDYLYDAFNIRADWDDTGAYGESGSYYGNSKYPGDWDKRKEALLWVQDYKCGRCGEVHEQKLKWDKSLSDFALHHIQFLSKGGDNSLENLVVLCADCHALMHPSNCRMNGSWRNAEIFPYEYSHPKVSTIRKNEKRETQHDRLQSIEEGTEDAGVNASGCSEQCYNIPLKEVRIAERSTDLSHMVNYVDNYTSPDLIRVENFDRFSELLSTSVSVD